MRGALILLRPAFISAGRFLSPTHGKPLRRLPVFMIAAAMWWGMYEGVHYVLGLLNSLGPLGRLISEKLISLSFFSLGGFLLISNTVSAVSAFYLARDLPLLMSKPVRMDDLQAFKSAEAVTNSSWMVLVYFPAMLAAYGRAADAPLSYYATAAVSMALFTLIPAGLGMALAHVLMRVFPGRRTREALLGLGLALFLGAYFFVRSASAGSDDALEGLISAILMIDVDTPFLPGYWASRLIMDGLAGHGADELLMAALAINAAMSLMLSHAIGGWIYGGNLLRGAGSASQRRGTGRAGHPRPGFSFAWKDARVFFRDPEQWPQLVLVAALLSVYVYNFKAIPMAAISALTPYAQPGAALFNLLLAGLVLTAVAARFLFVSVSLEGGAIWVPRTAPITPLAFLMNKLLYGLAPVMLLMQMLVVTGGMLMGQPARYIAIASIGTAAMCVSVSSMAVGLGALWPSYKHESIATVSIGIGSVTFMVMSFALVLLSVALLALAMYAWHSGGAWPEVTIAVGAAFALNALAAVVPMRLGMRRFGADLSI